MVVVSCLLRHRSKSGDLHCLIGFETQDSPVAVCVCLCLFSLFSAVFLSVSLWLFCVQPSLSLLWGLDRLVCRILTGIWLEARSCTNGGTLAGVQYAAVHKTSLASLQKMCSKIM